LGRGRLRAGLPQQRLYLSQGGGRFKVLDRDIGAEHLQAVGEPLLSTTALWIQLEGLLKEGFGLLILLGVGDPSRLAGEATSLLKVEMKEAFSLCKQAL